MPPSIDADASPNDHPRPLVHSDHGEHARGAFQTVEMVQNEDENELNSDITATINPTSLLDSLNSFHEKYFRQKNYVPCRDGRYSSVSTHLLLIPNYYSSLGPAMEKAML